MHLHSFSAQQLRDPRKTGAARCWNAARRSPSAMSTNPICISPTISASSTNACSPDIRWVEACWMAMPVASWQGVVLGDPLYRPFKHLDGSGVVTDEDNDFRALRAAALRWPNDPAERRKQLDKAAERTRSGVIAEAVGLDFLHDGLTAEAAARFRTAKGFYAADADKLRQDFHVIAIDRAANRKDLAIRGLRDAQDALRRDSRRPRPSKAGSTSSIRRRRRPRIRPRHRRRRSPRSQLRTIMIARNP